MKGKKFKLSLMVGIFFIICSIVNKNICFDFFFPSIEYNGKMYYQTESIDYNDETKDILIGEKKTQYLYTVKGYDEGFRICKIENSKIIFFENLDNIVIGNKGKKLYGDMLHLKGNIKDIQYIPHDRVDFNRDTYKYFTDIKDKNIDKFIDALYKSKVIEVKSSIYYELAQLHIYLKMQDGTIVPLCVFINGFVSYDAGSINRFVKIDQKIVQKLFDASEIGGQFSNSDIDESKYLISDGRDAYKEHIIVGAIVVLVLGILYILRIILKKRVHNHKKND